MLVRLIMQQQLAMLLSIAITVAVAPEESFAVEEKLIVGSASWPQFKKARWSCKCLLGYIDQDCCCQAPHKEMVVLKVVYPEV